MSQEGYDKLVAELKQLESVERPKASAAIAEAADKGDLSENAEYDAAKEAQAHLEQKINRIKVAISEAKIVDTSRLSTDTVQILSKVEMTNLALLGSGSLSLSLLLGEEILYQLLSLLLAHLQLVSNCILHSLCEIIDIQTFSSHRSQLATDADAKSITYFVHKIYL